MAGNFFGEGALLDHRPRNATVTAMTPCSLYKLRRKDLEVLVEVYPNIRKALELENERRKKENAGSLVASDASTFTHEDNAVTVSLPPLETFSESR
jgi:CRP-like cAMP-binding protein